MPKMMMDDDAQTDALYASGEPESEGPMGEGESIDDEAAETDTALAPLKVLKGKHAEPLKVGDEVVVKIVAIHGDEAEFAYSETPPSEIGGGEEKDYGDELEEMSSKNPGRY